MGNHARQTALPPWLGIGGLVMKAVMYWTFAVPATAIAALILMRLMNLPF